MFQRILSALFICQIVAASLAGCGDSSVSFCSGSVEFCADPPFDTAPVADAGPDQTVASGDVVALDGSGSRANGSGIRSYSWAQTSGAPVALRNAGTVRATFDAPETAEETALAFRLTVVNGSGTADSDSVNITIEPLATAARAAAAVLVAEHLRPAVLDTPSRCLTESGTPADPSEANVVFAALWLDVRARGASDDAVAVSEFLDEARRVLPWLHAALDTPSNAMADAFVASATKQLGRFSDRRDPSLHDAAAALAARLAAAREDQPTRVARGTHTLATVGNGIVLRRRSMSAAAAVLRVRSALAACEAQPDVPLAVDRLHLISLVSALLGASTVRE